MMKETGFISSVKQNRDHISLLFDDISFLAATAALEVQMLVCVSVCHTCYNCTKALN